MELKMEQKLTQEELKVIIINYQDRLNKCRNEE
jgi:hypothetical protein